MKVKTSVTLPEDLVRQMDRLSSQYGNRSALIEQAVRNLLAAETKYRQNAQDLQILNRRADALNQEAADVLSYQMDL